MLSSKRLPPYWRLLLKLRVAYPMQQRDERLVLFMTSNYLGGHLVGEYRGRRNDEQQGVGIVDGLSHLKEISRPRNAVSLVVPSGVTSGSQTLGYLEGDWGVFLYVAYEYLGHEMITETKGGDCRGLWQALWREL